MGGPPRPPAPPETHRRMILLRTLVGAGLLLSAAAAPAAPDPPAAELLDSRVRPVPANNCLTCHGPEKQRGGLRLDSRAALLRGSDAGPVVVPGRPDQSPLLRAVRREGEVKMPPKGKLPAAAVADLTAWVKMGAPWPAEAA